MARDRQRAKQRRRRATGSTGPRTRAQLARDIGLEDGTPAPDPLKHSSADVDEALLAEAGAVPPEVGEELVEAAPDALEEPGALPAAERPARARGGNRVVVFLRNCVEELRRVQWPDRRQVGQGTAVVLGFVILAGGYLGLLDAIWKPLIEAIL